MIAVLILIFSLVALLAAAFVVLPLLRLRESAGGPTKSRAWLAIVAGLATMALGLGAYALLGQPLIALSDLTGPSRTDYRALITTLARRMPQRPGDVEGWALLGRGYLALGNAAQAEKAFGRAVDAAKEIQGGVAPDLLANYGEAMAENAGQVTKEAEAVFRQALDEDPTNLVSRYYVGLALASRGDKAGALQLWESLLADAPPNTPWRSDLVNQVAALRAESGGAAPNPMAMVQQLASRLESNPDDINGWVMLIRAYAVLGDKPKAVAALTRARGVFANQAPAQAALTKVAQDNALN
ncbi:MAG TPA: tetratricopeptide repeat protein [Micropepsaceae bacterium]|nr:tetratricopeptide repeat protein [Micropepsaceae bacterium]